MAKQSGVLPIEGTVQNLTFYRSKDGYLVKTKSGVSKERIANEPSFQRTRENDAEFGSSATSGKNLRDAVRSLMMNAKDSKVVSRLVKVMTEIKNLDSTSARGARNVGVAIVGSPAMALLNGFNFNKNAHLNEILFAPYTVTTSTGVVSIPSLTPINDISYPAGATHVTISSAYAKVDFATGISAIEYSNAVNLPIDGTEAAQTLTPSAVPSGSGTKIYLLTVEFFQEINSVQYSLANGAFNALAIIDVA